MKTTNQAVFVKFATIGKNWYYSCCMYVVYLFFFFSSHQLLACPWFLHTTKSICCTQRTQLKTKQHDCLRLCGLGKKYATVWRKSVGFIILANLLVSIYYPHYSTVSKIISKTIYNKTVIIAIVLK